MLFAGAASAAPAPAAGGAESKYITIKSPMIGTFYRRSAPDKPNLVEVGDEVSPGKAVCIIEAMKLFNEIESEVKGKVVKVLDDTPRAPESKAFAKLLGMQPFGGTGAERVKYRIVEMK